LSNNHETILRVVAGVLAGDLTVRQKSAICFEVIETMLVAIGDQPASKPDSQPVKHQPRMVTALGRTMTITQWSKYSGIPYSTINNRLHSGWSEIDAVTVNPGSPR